MMSPTLFLNYVKQPTFAFYSRYNRQYVKIKQQTTKDFLGLKYHLFYFIQVRLINHFEHFILPRKYIYNVFHLSLQS